MSAILLYDKTCRFCQASANQVLRMAKVELADINDPQNQAKYEVSPAAAQREMHLVNPDGKVTHGGDAVRDIAKLTRWLWPAAYLWKIPGFGWVAQKIYLWIADHRYLFMGKVATEDCGDACSIHLGRAKNKK